MGKAERYRNIDMLGYKIFASDINSCLEKVFSMKKVHIVSGNPEVLYVGLNNKELFNIISYFSKKNNVSKINIDSENETLKLCDYIEKHAENIAV